MQMTPKLRKRTLAHWLHILFGVARIYTGNVTCPRSTSQFESKNNLIPALHPYPIPLRSVLPMGAEDQTDNLKVHKSTTKVEGWKGYCAVSLPWGLRGHQSVTQPYRHPAN